MRVEIDEGPQAMGRGLRCDPGGIRRDFSGMR
jgi:hypothetical protein